MQGWLSLPTSLCVCRVGGLKPVKRFSSPSSPWKLVWSAKTQLISKTAARCNAEIKGLLRVLNFPQMMIIRNFVPMLWQCWMGFIEVESQPDFLQQVNKMAKVLWIPLKSLKLCKSPLDLLEANQYDINKEESKLNEDERFEKWIFFFCGGFFFYETLALVDWVTGCVLTAWLSNEMGTVYVCWMRSFYSLSRFPS